MMVDDASTTEDLLAALGDTTLAASERLDALELLQARAFETAAFAAHRADYVQALRTLTGDPDDDLSEAALTILADHEDPFAQNLLIQGLQNPSVARLPAFLALQLLRGDGHAATAAVARDILANAADPEERAEAAHVLATDPTAAALLAAVVADTAEAAEVREAAAMSLRNIDGPAFAAAARPIVADETDNWRVRTTSKTLLALLPADQGGDGEVG